MPTLGSRLNGGLDNLSYKEESKKSMAGSAL